MIGTTGTLSRAKNCSTLLVLPQPHGPVDVKRLSGCAHPPRAQDGERRLLEDVAVVDLRHQFVRLGKAAHRHRHAGEAEAIERNFYSCPFHKHSLRARDALRRPLGLVLKPRKGRRRARPGEHAR